MNLQNIEDAKRVIALCNKLQQENNLFTEVLKDIARYDFTMRHRMSSSAVSLDTSQINRAVRQGLQQIITQNQQQIENIKLAEFD